MIWWAGVCCTPETTLLCQHLPNVKLLSTKVVNINNVPVFIHVFLHCSELFISPLNNVRRLNSNLHFCATSFPFKTHGMEHQTKKVNFLSKSVDNFWNCGHFLLIKTKIFYQILNYSLVKLVAMKFIFLNSWSFLPWTNEISPASVSSFLI